MKKVPLNGAGIFFLAPKTGTGLSCTIYKIPVNFSLSLDVKPGTSNPNKWYRKFRSFRQKRENGNTSKGVTLFPENFHRDETFHWIFPGISGFSIQIVKALRFTFTPNGNR